MIGEVHETPGVTLTVCYDPILLNITQSNKTKGPASFAGGVNSYGLPGWTLEHSDSADFPATFKST